MTPFADIAQIIRTAAQQAVDRATVERGAAWIVAAQEEFPAVTNIVLAMLRKSPDQVLKSLGAFDPELKALRKNPNAIAFITALQDHLKKTGKMER